MKRINKPICFVVANKTYTTTHHHGVVCEFIRDKKGEPKLFSTMQSALKAVKEIRQKENNNDWVAMTTWRLADCHAV